MTSYPNKAINFYLLAGGKSSRMGADKGLLKIKEKCMIEFAIEQIKPIANNIYIVTNNEAYIKFDCEIITDEIENIGPAGGIYTALKHSNTEHNFILSCDMPFITTQAIAYMISESADFDITLPVFDQRTEPLFAVYAKNITVKWLQLLHQENYKLQNIVNHFKVKKINVASHPLFSKKLFMNINTPEDLEKAKLL